MDNGNHFLFIYITFDEILLSFCVIFYMTPAAQVYEELEAGGAFDDGSIARNNLFLSLHDAVLFAQQTTGERCGPVKVGKTA